MVVPGPENGPGAPPAVPSERADVLRLGALLALRDVELDVLTLVEALVALRLDGGEVDEHVGAAVRRRDEPEALLGVEPLHGALCHLSRPSVSLAPRGGTWPPRCLRFGDEPPAVDPANKCTTRTATSSESLQAPGAAVTVPAHMPRRHAWLRARPGAGAGAGSRRERCRA